MYGALHVENTWLSRQAYEVIEQSGYEVCQVRDAVPGNGSFPELGKILERNNAKVTPLRLNVDDTVWVISLPGEKDPLVILPSEIGRQTELLKKLS